MAQKEKVTRIIDGDTFETDKRKNPVRLSNYDAPEEGKKGYNQAKQKLENLIKNKEVKIDSEARDKWGRAVANVYDGRESVNKKMRGK